MRLVDKMLDEDFTPANLRIDLVAPLAELAAQVCTALQYVAVFCALCFLNIDLVVPLAELATQVCNVLHFVAACCSVLQQCVHRSCGAARAAGNTGVHFIAVCCASVQSIVVCCSLLQSVAVYCSLLQSVMHFPP